MYTAQLQPLLADLPVVALQLLCVAVAVGLSRALVPAMAEIRRVTEYEYLCGGVAATVLRMPRAATHLDEPYDLYHYGDVGTEPYRRNMHLWMAAVLGALAPLLPLGRNPIGLAGLVVLATLFSHMATIDMGESRLPTALSQISGLIALATVVLAGVFGDDPEGTERLYSAAAGGLIVLLGYLLLYAIRPDSLGFGDVQLSVSVGLILGWNGLTVLAYGFAAAWVLQGLVSVVMLLFQVTSLKAMLPLGPAIMLTSFLVPALLA